MGATRRGELSPSSTHSSRFSKYHDTRYTLPIGAVDTHRPKPARANRPHSAVDDLKEAEQPASRASTARDYFGDYDKADKGVVDRVANAVKEALERDKEMREEY